MSDFEGLKEKLVKAAEYYAKNPKELSVAEQKLKSISAFVSYIKKAPTIITLKDIAYPILAIMKGLDPGSYQAVKNNPSTFSHFQELWNVVKDVAPELFSISSSSSSQDGGTKIAPTITEGGCSDRKPLPVGSTTFDDIAGQTAVKNDIRMNYIYPFTYPGLFPEKSQGILFYGPPGTGKCLGPEEEVIMFNGTTKKAMHIKPYDVLMGDDSTPRYVYSTTSGTDRMYRITPQDGYGESFVVNEPHILSLLKESKPKLYPMKDGYKVVWSEGEGVSSSFFKGNDESTKTTAQYYLESKIGSYEVIDIELSRYMKMKPKEKAKLLGFRRCVDWRYDATLTSPFEVGQTIREMDEIPNVYIVNDRHMRLEFLSGVLVAFGYSRHSSKYTCSSLKERVIKQLSFLGRSLGMNVRENDTSVVFSLTDMCPSVPIERRHDSPLCICPKDIPNKFSFKVTPLGEGRYFGFSISGNQRFLLKDFTVTHNTMLARAATADVPNAAFWAPTPGDIKGKYEGETEKNIRDIFRCADELVGTEVKIGGVKKRIDTSIIFLDEADSVAGERSRNESMSRSTNALLQAMDGILKTKGTSAILATNFPWTIDSAILRRLSAKIFVDKPDEGAIRWLVEDSIKRLFRPPGIMYGEGRMTVEEIENTDEYDEDSISRILSNMSSRSNSFCSVGTRSHPFTYEVDEEKEVKTGYITTTTTKVRERVKRTSGGNVIDDNFITYLVQSFGHSPKMGEFIEEIENGTRKKLTDLVPVEDYNPGYSASDISKVMSLAARKSGLEAMYGIFRKITFYVKNTGASTSDSKARVPIEYYVSSYVGDIVGNKFEVYFIHNTEEVKDARLKLKRSGNAFTQIPEDEHKLCINFNLCPGHVVSAMKEYPSSIKLDDYYNLLMWKWFGVTPEQEN